MVDYATEPVILRTRSLLPAMALACLLLSCNGETPTADGTPATPASPVSPGGTVLPTTTGDGKELAGECVNSYTSPPEGDPLRDDAIRALRKAMGFRGDFHVEEMRYFEGPESPPSERDYALLVKRWYVKGWPEEDPSIQGRWLIERRAFGVGVSAVAPFDSEGFASPDWVGFQFEGPDAALEAYPGLPGEWAGEPYDFVTGKALETEEEVFGFPGLPVEVIGCLAGS